MRLFNVIQQSQSAATEATQEAKKSRGTGKPGLVAPTFDKGEVKRKQKDNTLGRGKEGEILRDKSCLRFLCLFSCVGQG